MNLPVVQNGFVEASVAGKTERVRLIYTSHSIDNLFDYCARKFEFLNVWDKRPPRESGYAANIGTALHDGVQAWLIARQEGRPAAECESIGFFAMLMKFPFAAESEQKTKARSFENTVTLMYEIISSHEWDNWELMRVAGHGWAIEVPFVIHHTSMGIFRLAATGELCMFATQGKIDFVLQHRITKKIKTADLKTTITGENLVRSEYMHSGQQVGYSDVIKAALGADLNNVEYEYIVARFNAYDPPQVQWLPVEKGLEEVEDYWLTKIDRLERMKKFAISGWFPRTNGGCNSWNHECSCFDICMTRDSDVIRQWFAGMDAEPQQGYDPWITLEL